MYGGQRKGSCIFTSVLYNSDAVFTVAELFAPALADNLKYKFGTWHSGTRHITILLDAAGNT